MTVTIGGITAERVPDFIAAMGGPFLFDVAADRIDDEVAHFRDLFELDRLRCAFDGDRIVGTLGAFSFDMTTPGSTTACAGTTVVTVQPTHRRQGLLRRLIEAHFDDARARQEPMAALYASDSGIYGRFGFGLASVSAEITLDPRHASLHRLAPDVEPVSAVETADVEATVADLFERVRLTRPGMFHRDDAWWRTTLRDDPRDRDGATASRHVVAGESGRVEGYARYRVKPGEWSGGHGDGTAEVREVIAETPVAAASLWAFLTNLDLVSTVHGQMLPEDEPVLDLLAAWRRGRPTISDQLWVRLLDVRGALESRRYEADGTVRFRVHDPVDGTTRGYRLDVVDGHGTCSPGDDGAVELDIEDLGSAYLGRPRFRALACAGRLRGPAADLTRADQMFGWSPAPWCQQLF